VEAVPSPSMATVRLFAHLRELAGSSRMEVEGGTVAEVIAETGRRVGPEFVAAVETARVWRNGEEAAPGDPVAPGDEVALLPPVSGGAAAVRMPPELAIGAPLVLAAVLVVLNLGADPAWWAAATVGVVGLWITDVATQMELRGRSIPTLAVLVGVVAGAVVSHAYGPTGMSVAVAFAVMAVLTWGVGVMGYRSVASVAPGVLVGVLAASAAGSLVLTRSEHVVDAQAIDVYLLVVGVATVAGLVVDRLGDMPYLDPFTVTALAAIVAALSGAFLWDLDVAGYLLVGLGTAVTLVAGRGLGSLLRLGGVALTDRAPGALTALDGPVLAAALYFPLVQVVL
jgi:sulfur-carrier protein